MIGRCLVVAAMALLAASCGRSTAAGPVVVSTPAPTLQTTCEVGPPFALNPGWSVSDADVSVTLTNDGPAAVTVSTAAVEFTAGAYDVTTGTLSVAGGAQSYTLGPGRSITATDTLYDIAGEATYSPMPTGCAVESWAP